MIRQLLRKPFMCRKTLRRGWVAVNRDGKITWEYNPIEAQNVQISQAIARPYGGIVGPYVGSWLDSVEPSEEQRILASCDRKT